MVTYADVNAYAGIVGAITGIIGAITGTISLIWLIYKSRSRLILNEAYFEHGGFGILKPRGMQIMGVRLKFRNKSDKSTTVEKVTITANTEEKNPPNFKAFTIEPNTSHTYEFEIMYWPNEYDNIVNNLPIKFHVNIIHTFGEINKSKKTDFKGGSCIIKPFW